MLKRLMIAAIAVATLAGSASAASVNDLRGMGYSLLPVDSDTIDVGTGDLIFQANPGTRDAVLSLVQELVLNARNGGRWDGVGLTSSAAAGNRLTGLAVALNERDGEPLFTTFAGKAVDENSVLVVYTWNGDLNLDGTVNSDDYFRIDAGFMHQSKGRHSGDVNQDGRINSDDYFLMDNSFLGQSAHRTPRAASVFTITDNETVAVPLPSAAWQGAALLLAGSVTAVLRRRAPAARRG